MPDETFWRDRFTSLGEHSVGPGDTSSAEELEAHRRLFVEGCGQWLSQLAGPVLDFGCGVGRWVEDLPRPYLGMDLLPEHLAICRQRWVSDPRVAFAPSEELPRTAAGSLQSVFCCTVLQHIVERGARERTLASLGRALKSGGLVLLIEWASGQREYDWCRSVSARELSRHFDVAAVGEVVEAGRRHTIWFGKPRNTLSSRLRNAVRSGVRDSSSRGK